MDNKLKDAISAARLGDKETAQRQLTELLDEDPQQVQGWYLLSLLVDSPQKQAAYLSKTLALNPEHEKAKAQLAALQAAGTLAQTSTVSQEVGQPMDVLAQSETDELPIWLREEGGEGITAVPVEAAEETAVPSEDLPDWLKEPVSLADASSPITAVEEKPTVVNKKDHAASKPDKIATDLKRTLDRPQPRQPKTTTKQSTRNLNILLGILVTLAAIVMIMLAYLLLS